MPIAFPGRRSRGRILVVDDDPALSLLLAQALRDVGFDVEIFANGLLPGVDLSSVDLLITDLFMPDHDGVELLTRLRREAPHVRTVVITGNPDFHGLDVLRMARLMHADATLAKPFSSEVLIETCTALLGEPETAAR